MVNLYFWGTKILMMALLMLVEVLKRQAFVTLLNGDMQILFVLRFHDCHENPILVSNIIVVLTSLSIFEPVFMTSKLWHT